jgi:hypothetical protein
MRLLFKASSGNEAIVKIHKTDGGYVNDVLWRYKNLTDKDVSELEGFVKKALNAADSLSIVERDEPTRQKMLKTLLGSKGGVS